MDTATRKSDHDLHETDRPIRSAWSPAHLLLFASCRRQTGAASGAPIAASLLAELGACRPWDAVALSAEKLWTAPLGESGPHSSTHAAKIARVAPANRALGPRDGSGVW